MTSKDAVEYFCPYSNSNCKGGGYKGEKCMFWVEEIGCLLRFDLMRSIEGTSNDKNITY